MILIELLPSALYAALALWLARPAMLAQALPAPGSSSRTAALAFALVVHGVVLSHQLFPDGQMRFGAADALAVMTWLALVFYWVESLSSRLDGLHTLALPVAAVCAAIPVIWPDRHAIGNADNLLFRTHFVMAMTAYSLFTLAALHAMLMSAVERSLHKGRLTRLLDNMPPLLVMEGLLFRLITVAFVLLSATLVSGIVFSEQVFGKPLTFNHKTFFAILSWVLFGILLAGRHFRGWRGRLALRWTLGGFFVLLLAYIGTRFVVEVVLGRN
ncbi:cytochrome c biogenesis protein CcsA [Methyloversatilis sp. XJ19-13]|uniref:cytochrome C assembly family protein n=1 Tax=Methyloversatilis sp. XJ19-13 TaxID=2963430 RepID=UPI00211B886D|nr:cytochrome c biogenesis protein CcsA [Methyloversatilis sp. XJ19-13]MCQ9373865.1 cytochrome c biogenesis protein CcsA [Methyloversatilis sp. XJ19-13]